MEILNIVILLVFPAIAILIAQRIPALNAIILCYAAGILIGNTIPEYVAHDTVRSIIEVMVVLALPLLLFSSDFKGWLKNPGMMLKSYGLLLVSVTIASFVGFYAFNELTDAPIIASMYSGVISGGTPNLNAIGIALNAGDEMFVLLNGYDVILSGSYFFLLVSIARPLLSKILPTKEKGEKKKDVPLQFQNVTLKSFKGHLKNVVVALLWGIGSVGFTIGLSFLFFDELNALFVVIGASSLGILFSFNKRIRALPLTYETADYLLLIFAFGMGTLAQFDKLVSSDWRSFAMCAIIFGVMLILHISLSKLLKVDTDHFMISSTAGVFGPPFIGPVANATGNQKLIAPGVAMAIFGNAIGTYLGIVLFEIFKNL